MFKYPDASGKSRLLNASISGTSAWRLLSVNDEETGEVVLTEKFYKKDFDKVMANPALKPYVDKVIEAAYTVNIGDKASEGESPTHDDGDD